MKHVSVDLKKEIASIKPMHGMNNGPIPGSDSRGRGNAGIFVEMGTPFIRNHDASFCPEYGGEHTVDVAFIFPDFEADENDPANYDFDYTDAYCKAVYEAGAKLVYRLGSKIEHGFKKYNTVPPSDYAKWARICEHIIRHLVYGWADGLHLDIQYWEIWNEADGINPNGVSACWQGTEEEFYEFYCEVAGYLKGKFPELKIGGPAFTGISDDRNMEKGFITYAAKHKAPLDFYSWHGYTVDPKHFSEAACRVRRLLDENGYDQTEMHLNEWNYMSSWVGEEHIECLRSMTTNRAAAFCAACVLEAQHSPIDMLMYYDAAPRSEYNGLVDHYDYLKKMKPFYTFWQFNQLYRLKNEVQTISDCEDLYVCAASENGKSAIMLVFYSPDQVENDTVEIWLRGLPEKCMVTSLLLDEKHDSEPVRKDIFAVCEGAVYLEVKNHNTYLLQIEALE